MKSVPAILLGCLATFWTSRSIAQQPTMTGLVPQSSSHAIVFRNVQELKERGDELSEELGYSRSGMSMLFAIAGSQLKVTGAADDNLPCGVMWFEPALIGEADVKQDWKKPVAAGIAISNTKKLAENLNVDHDHLIAGKTIEREDSTFGHKHRYFRLIDRYLWVVSHEKLYDVLKDVKPLTQAVPRSRLENIDSADFLICISAEPRKDEFEAARRQAEKWIESREDLDISEENAIRELASILQHASYAVLTGKVDRGFESSLNIFFDQNTSPELRQRILQFSPPAEGVTLTGLPEGDLLFGHAARTDAAGIQAALTATVRESRGFWWPGWKQMQDNRFAGRLEQLKLLGLFGEVWPLTSRYKVGLYREENDAAHGLVSLAAILETDAPDRMVRELEALAALIDRSAFGSAENADDREKTQQLIRELIAQLGDANFQQRQSATTRLVIIGEPALPQIAEARLSKSPEIARRATQIEKLIQEDISAKRAAALDSSILARAKPVFIFHPDAEERRGATVHVMEVRLSEDSELQPLLPVFAGPEWSRIRLVKLERHVAVFFGSNLERLDQMIRNVQSLERGDSGPVLELPYGSPLLDMRGAEFQGSVARIKRLLDGQRLTEQERESLNDHELSSASVTIEPDFFAVEWRVSLPDTKAVKKIGF